MVGIASALDVIGRSTRKENDMNEKKEDITYQGQVVGNPTDGYACYIRKFHLLDVKFAYKIPWQLDMISAITGIPDFCAVDEDFGKYLLSCVEKNETCSEKNFCDFFYGQQDGSYKDELISVEAETIEDFICKADKWVPEGDV